MNVRVALIVLSLVSANHRVAIAEESASGLIEIKPIKRTMPRYPTKALEYEQPGNVRVRISIDNEGTPTAVDVLSEVPADYNFGREAVDSVEDWEFKPDVPGTYMVKVNFRLEPPEAYAKAGVDIDTATALAPSPIDYVPPVYPLLAQELKLEAVVRLIIVVRDGRVTSAGVVNDDMLPTRAGSFTIFGNGAYNAVMQWRFDDDLNGTFRVVLPFTLDALAKGQFRSKPQRG